MIIVILLCKNEDNKILKYNYGEKLLKAPAIIFPDLECFLEKKSSNVKIIQKSVTPKKI